LTGQINLEKFNLTTLWLIDSVTFSRVATQTHPFQHFVEMDIVVAPKLNRNQNLDTAIVASNNNENKMVSAETKRKLSVHLKKLWKQTTNYMSNNSKQLRTIGRG